MLTLQNSEHGVCIIREINSAFEGLHPCDLKFICADNEIILAHRLILAAASPLLRELLAETQILNESITTIHFPDISVYYLRLLVNFLYTGETWVSPQEVEEVQDLLVLLQMNDFKTFDISSTQVNDNNENISNLEQSRKDSSDSLLVVVKCERSNDGYSDLVQGGSESNITPSDFDLFKTEPLSSVFTPEYDDEIFYSDDSDNDTESEQQARQTTLTDQDGDNKKSINKKSTEFECNHCQRKFKVLSHLRGHLRVHTCEKPYKCGMCNAKFTSRYNVFRHISRKHQKKNLKKVVDKQPCSYCSQSFETCQKLVQHLGVAHFNLCVNELTSNYTTPKIEYACPLCKVKFLRTIKLFSHLFSKHDNAMRLSTKPKYYKCCFCPLSCTSKRTLNCHIRQHHVNLLICQNLHSKL